MRVYVLWEEYKTYRWIANIYLSKESAKEFIRKNPKNTYRIEEYKVLG